MGGSLVVQKTPARSVGSSVSGKRKEARLCIGIEDQVVLSLRVEAWRLLSLTSPSALSPRKWSIKHLVTASPSFMKIRLHHYLHHTPRDRIVCSSDDLLPTSAEQRVSYGFRAAWKGQGKLTYVWYPSQW